jgi:hypothetical protein
MPDLLRALPVVALAFLPLAASAQEGPAAPGPARVITVTGEGRSDRKPDMAVVSLGVSHQAQTAGEAMAMMADGMTAVLATLTEAGVVPADVQTGQLTLEAAYNYDTGSSTPPVTGFIATQTVDVRVRDVGAVGPVLDAVTAEGANRVNGVFFALDDQAAALDEARTEAVADGRARAEFYAGAAGVTLGPLLQVSEGSAFGGPQPFYDGRLAQEAAAPTPVAPGQVTVSATVTMTFAIE